MPKYIFPSSPMIHFPSILEYLRHDFKYGFASRAECFDKIRPIFPAEAVPDEVINDLVDGNYTTSDDGEVIVEKGEEG